MKSYVAEVMGCLILKMMFADVKDIAEATSWKK
jgi:hypothetical protein